MNQQLTDLYKREERAEIIVMNKEKELELWRGELERVRELIRKMEGKP